MWAGFSRQEPPEVGMAKNEVLDPSPGKDTRFRMPRGQQGGGAGREELYRSHVSGKDRISPAQAAVGWTVSLQGAAAWCQPGREGPEKTN